MARSSDQLARLNARFAAVSRAARDAVKPSLDQGADQLVAAARHLVPTDDGTLKDSIRVEAGEHELELLVVAGGGPAFYAVHVEHGTTQAAAQPFFFPAWRLNKKQIQARIKRAIGKAVRDTWGKA
ncbi:HK97-gp10 family putative phage morphogenesis protein [Aureimonas leprariae]|uniref:HK97 gp10 family phage protein n=1 Tax=Plantimonas leprariae TaxID=2615207 RepID=A0A7V7PNS5_9HYPH|nr:HK97-gp10 family putative phage morphogenesis protein [Aureimonas leprariae]KAB0679524.1 HK97 gp10 family phage protein [Aureimonas leprariae]